MTEEYKMGKLNIVGLENSKYKTYNWSSLGYYVGTNQSMSLPESGSGGSQVYSCHSGCWDSEIVSFRAVGFV